MATTKFYPIPDPGMAVLLVATRETEDARVKLRAAEAEVSQCEARHTAFLSALLAALGVPDGARVEVNMQTKCVTAYKEVGP